jgi:hypothetical protein
MPIPGKLEVTIKINQLPTEVTTTKNGWKEFRLDCGGRNVTISLRPRMWTKLEEASKSWPLWLAAITGQMGQSQGQGFTLVEPALQVFERKARADKPAEAVPPAPAEAAPAAQVGPAPSEPTVEYRGERGAVAEEPLG